MEVTLKDATGTGKTGRIDNNNRQAALADSRSIFQFAAQLGDTFNFNTGSIELTSGDESAVAFLQNSSADIIVIPAIGFLLGNSTGGLDTEDLNLKVIRNPKAGTIITNAVAIDVFQNKNAGSNNTFTITEMPRFKGVEADTFTDGDDWFLTVLPGASRIHIINTGDLVLLPGSSIGVTVTPQATNTSMDLQIFMAVNDISNAIL